MNLFGFTDSTLWLKMIQVCSMRMGNTFWWKAIYAELKKGFDHQNNAF